MMRGGLKTSREGSLRGKTCMCTMRTHRWPSQLEEERRTWFSLSRQKGREGERRGGRLLKGKEEGEKSTVLLLLLYLMGRGENSPSTRRGVLDLRVSTPANVSNASSEGDPTSCQEPVCIRDALDQLGPSLSLCCPEVPVYRARKSQTSWRKLGSPQNALGTIDLHSFPFPILQPVAS